MLLSDDLCLCLQLCEVDGASVRIKCANSNHALLLLLIMNLQDFAAMFGNPLKGRAYPLDFMNLGQPQCFGYLGCMYI